ncbi:hypothetical protein D3C72_2536640 [compost metagenome]
MLHIAVDSQPKIVGAVQRLGIQIRGGVIARHDLHMRRAGVVLLQARVQLLGIHAGWQQAQVQRDGQDNALAECAV